MYWSMPLPLGVLAKTRDITTKKDKDIPSLLLNFFLIIIFNLSKMFFFCCSDGLSLLLHLFNLSWGYNEI